MTTWFRGRKPPLLITAEDDAIWQRWIDKRGQHDKFLLAMTRIQLAGDRRDADVMYIAQLDKATVGLFEQSGSRGVIRVRGKGRGYDRYNLTELTDLT